MITDLDLTKINRYRSQSLRTLEQAISELRRGRWNRSEELLWGSLTLAVKGAALSRGDSVEDAPAVQAYARQLATDLRDRRLRDAFQQLASITDSLERSRETRRRADGVSRALDDICGSVEILWDLVDTNLASRERRPE